MKKTSKSGLDPFVYKPEKYLEYLNHDRIKLKYTNEIKLRKNTIEILNKNKNSLYKKELHKVLNIDNNSQYLLNARKAYKELFTHDNAENIKNTHYYYHDLITCELCQLCIIYEAEKHMNKLSHGHIEILMYIEDLINPYIYVNHDDACKYLNTCSDSKITENVDNILENQKKDINYSAYTGIEPIMLSNIYGGNGGDSIQTTGDIIQVCLDN